MALTGAGATPAIAAPGESMSGGPMTAVIVRTDSGAALSRAEAYVRRAGGTVDRELSLISGFAGQVPAGAVASLRQSPGVAEVTADGTVRMKADTWLDTGGANSTVATVKRGAGGKKANTVALTGAGVGVALIDSGVAPVAGLNQPGKVINGPDLSFESQTPGLADTDTYGHGTHMAGIIAGSDPASGFEGIAPGANLISLKVAAADGAADVSQVIAAIDWVVEHRNDAGLNIRVLNLSFGTDSTQSEVLDPLSFAVETAWKKGIVVVVAVGNDGPTASRVTMPAANPYVIAVGAADTNGTETLGDDTVATFSTRGNATRHADVLAAGRSVVSLRDPGSYIDVNYPAARVSDQFFRGSGTSQATAVVSGTVALLLQNSPKLSPDQVKNLLMESADPLGTDPIAAGAGEIDISSAVTLSTPKKGTQSFPAATGLGSLEASRGTSHVVDATTGTVLTGEKDIFGTPWNPATWTKGAAKSTQWTGGTWNGNVWAGTAYTGSSWTALTWNIAPWTGTNWAGRAWTGSNWTGRAWTAAGWTGRAWTSGSWLGRAWTGRAWT
ncbi:S8 family serine peptidase [Paractinoplanes globisporus]|uniref:S8 family serine peptidase n=1 Tax=Paractinoplanes globisporus TaxID=113565 RepID=A0ABW6W8V7_9ACTN|nr:S8 family serine peptidase [Actinoplanes globisporus]